MTTAHTFVVDSVLFSYHGCSNRSIFGIGRGREDVAHHLRSKRLGGEGAGGLPGMVRVAERGFE